MPWPSRLFSSKDEHEERKTSRPTDSSWSTAQPATTWEQYTSPSTIVPTVIMTSTILFGRHLYKLYLRRIPGATRISDRFWHKRSLLGRVTSVGDGDGFRLFHTPGGRLAGWGWLPWRKVPKGKELKNQTISIRLAGVDAPETAHFGRPSQPGGAEALEWLTAYINNRRVRAYVLKKDQYDRAVARVFVWKGILRRDIGLEMLKRGLATVYEAKSGAEFGGHAVEQKYRKMEQWAKRKRRGIWEASGKGKGWESPREFKSRTKDIPSEEKT